MGVTVVTLWVICILAILVLAIVLSFPDLKTKHQPLIAVFFAVAGAAIIVTFVPVDLHSDMDVFLYNLLIALTYMVSIILIIIIAVSGIHHRRKSHNSVSSEKPIEAEISCDQAIDGSPQNCQVDNVKLRRTRRPRDINFR